MPGGGPAIFRADLVHRGMPILDFHSSRLSYQIIGVQASCDQWFGLFDWVRFSDAPGIAWTATSVPHIVTAYLLHNKPIGPADIAQQVAPAALHNL